jgi:hypothetical protein
MWVFYSLKLRKNLIFLQSLAIGRPPSIRLSYIDCEFPTDDEATLDKDGKSLIGCMLLQDINLTRL